MRTFTLSTARETPGGSRREAMKLRVGQGFDAHPLEPGRRLILGGVEIPYERGLRGHSDADVLTHALAGAILGALGEGDLGRHFPDTDPRYADVSSLTLLAEVWRMAQSRGFALVNADLTVFAQRPKLAPHLPAMREQLAQVLHAEPARINVKASSPEGIGALGRGDGIAASAIVLLEAG